MNLTFDLTLDYLQELWSRQQGACAVSDLPMELRAGDLWGPRTPSLDRLDNDAGYVQGNVRFVCLQYNFMRNAFSDADCLELARALVLVADKHSQCCYNPPAWHSPPSTYCRAAAS